MSAQLIRAVQTCRRKVEGLAEDDVWRDFLAATVGKRSLRAMTGPELGRVVDALHARGAPSAGRRHLAADPQSRKVRALWLTLAAAGVVRDRSERALAAWCARQLRREIGHDIADLRFLDGETAAKSRLIDALKDWGRREGVHVDG